MEKIDFKKSLKHLYKPNKSDFTVVDVPAMNFLMVNGHGDPNTAAEYTAAIEALYGVAYKLKFSSKKLFEKDYVVPPLEGLWWADDIESFSTTRDKSQWDWTMMIMTPEWITQALFMEVAASVLKAKDLPAIEKMRLVSYKEGLSAQILHIGSYDDEGPTLLRLHNEWLPEHSYVENGKHHEIYLGDPRRTAPEKLQTVLRQPIRSMR